jgi:hypothetical protein
VVDPVTFQITGIGTTRTNSGAGLQAFGLDLTSGSDAVGPQYTFGWFDGTASPLSSDFGNIQFDESGTPPGYLWMGPDQIPVLGNSYSNAGSSLPDRTYSVQFTEVPASSAVPEPSSLTLLAGGALALMVLSIRKEC